VLPREDADKYGGTTWPVEESPATFEICPIQIALVQVVGVEQCPPDVVRQLEVFRHNLPERHLFPPRQREIHSSIIIKISSSCTFSFSIHPLVITQKRKQKEKVHTNTILPKTMTTIACSSSADSSAESSFLEIPEHFTCPLTLTLLEDPLCSKYGHNFERTAILDWLYSGKDTCPITRQPLIPPMLIPNTSLRQRIHAWKSANEAALLLISSEEEDLSDDVNNRERQSSSIKTKIRSCSSVKDLIMENDRQIQEIRKQAQDDLDDEYDVKSEYYFDPHSKNMTTATSSSLTKLLSVSRTSRKRTKTLPGVEAHRTSR